MANAEFIPTMQPQYLPGGQQYDAVLKIHGGSTLAEIKEDGYRVQMHKSGESITGYTRAGNALLMRLYPEIAASMRSLPDCIIDGELVQHGKAGMAAFEGVKRRFRHKTSERSSAEYLKSGITEEFPLELRVFDALSYQGKDLKNLPIEQRRSYLVNLAGDRIIPNDQRIIGSAGELETMFEELTGMNYEGLVCKRQGSIYQPGQKNNDWIKLKRAEPLDVVVTGLYLDNGRIGRVLCSTYNPEQQRYETIGIVNARRNDLDLEISEAIRDTRHQKTTPHMLNIDRLRETPDAFIDPAKSVVVEVKAMQVQRGKNNYTCGIDGQGNAYSLRIGWLSKVRRDKRPTDAATNSEIAARFAAEQEAA